MTYDNLHITCNCLQVIQVQLITHVIFVCNLNNLVWIIHVVNVNPYPMNLCTSHFLELSIIRFWEFEDKNLILVELGQSAWDVQPGLGVHWCQRLITYGSSRVRVKAVKGTICIDFSIVIQGLLILSKHFTFLWAPILLGHWAYTM